MKKFIENLTNIWKIEELKNRIILTLGILLVYRFGAHIVLPGIDSAQLHELATKTSGGGLLDILNAFTGGAFSNAPRPQLPWPTTAKVLETRSPRYYSSD